MAGEHQESGRDQQGSPASRREPGRLRRVVRRTVVGAWDDDIFSESASAAFWQTLSLPPLLLGLFGILGYVGGWFGPNTVDAVQQWIVQITSNVFSRNAVEEIIAPTVRDVLTSARGEVVSVGFLLSLWSGSSAMAAFVDAITRAYRQYQLRNLIWQRTLAVLLYLIALVFVIVALPVVAVGPERLLALVPDAFEPGVEAMISGLTTPVVGLVLVLALTMLYRIALPYKPPWWRGLPGALLAGVVFLVGATGLRAYLDWVTSTGYTYGALAAPIAFLLGTFFIAFAIVLGAHLNAAVQAEWPTPLRRRGKIVVRELPAGSVAVAEVVRLASAVRRDPDAAVAVLDQLGYQVVRPGSEAPAQTDPGQTEPGQSGSAQPEAQDHAPPDMAADRAR
jgi:membrane protein